MAPNIATGNPPAPGAGRAPGSRLPASGFTIIELLIVMTIMIVLASIGMTQYRNSVTRAEEATLKENLFRMRDAMDQFYADKNKWPADLSELVSEGYIREVPVDPMTKSKETWQTKQAESDPNNPSASGGIDDVHSGSERTGLDGTRYADWD
jgi:general secretion pathway protein G